MWGAGICERCGTVVAFRTTTPVVKNLVKWREYYCPLCGMYKLKNVQAVVNAAELETTYNQLRLGVILNNTREGTKNVATDETTTELVEQAQTRRDTIYQLIRDRARGSEEGQQTCPS